MPIRGSGAPVGSEVATHSGDIGPVNGVIARRLRHPGRHCIVRDGRPVHGPVDGGGPHDRPPVSAPSALECTALPSAEWGGRDEGAP